MTAAATLTETVATNSLPWIYPPSFKSKFYASYANGSKTVPPATNPTYPVGTTPIGWHQCAEMPVESLEVPFPKEKVSALRLEYFATISYVDEQIGRLLDALEDVGVAENTAVLFLGDQCAHALSSFAKLPAVPYSVRLCAAAGGSSGSEHPSSVCAFWRPSR